MPIFKDRQKLSSKHVPSRLPHRDKQLTQLYVLFGDVLDGNPFFKTVQLIGSVGTGKTSSSMLFARRLSSKNNRVKFLYINLKKLSEPSPFLVYSELLSSLGLKASRSRSPGELFEKFVSAIQKMEKNTFIIILDEADEFTGARSLKGGKIVYNLSRFPEFGVENVAGTVFIARRREWSEGLSLEEQSSLGSIVVYYPRYTKEQIIDILSYRASEAFREGVLGYELIEYLADITVDLFQSDIRKALDILLYAGVLAEMESSRRVEFQHLSKAIRGVLGYTVISSDILSLLSTRDKIILYASILSSENSHRGYTSFSSVKEYAEMICESLNMEKIPEELIEESLQKLYELGIISINGPRKIHVSSLLNISELKREILFSVKNSN